MVTHKEWDFRDDFTEFILSVALQLIFPGTAVNLYIFVQIINKPLKNILKAEDLI